MSVWVLVLGGCRESRPCALSLCFSPADLHPSPKGSLPIIPNAFPSIAFSLLYFCLISINQIANQRGKGHIRQFQSFSHAVFWTHVERGARWSFRSRGHSSICRAASAFPSLEQPRLPHSTLSLTVDPLHQKISSLAQATVLFFVSHGSGSRSEKMPENGKSYPQ